MSEIKEVYVIEWMGPYNSLDEMYEREGIDSCCIYLITGRLPYDRRPSIKYVGITKRPPSKRLKDKDHQEKQKDIKENGSQYQDITTLTLLQDVVALKL